MVNTRARSLRTCRTRAGFSSWPVTFCRRRAKSCSERSRSFSRSSSNLWPRNCEAFIAPFIVSPQLFVAGDEPRLDRQLVRGQTHRRLRHVGRHALELVEDARRLHHGDPLLGVALALAHAGLERLLGDRLVGKDADPHLAAALDVARDGDTGGLDLPRRHPAGLHGLQGVVAEGDVVPPLGGPGTPAALLLPELDLLRHQHKKISERFPCRSAFY